MNELSSDRPASSASPCTCTETRCCPMVFITHHMKQSLITLTQPSVSDAAQLTRTQRPHALPSSSLPFPSPTRPPEMYLLIYQTVFLPCPALPLPGPCLAPVLSLLCGRGNYRSLIAINPAGGQQPARVGLFRVSHKASLACGRHSSRRRPIASSPSLSTPLYYINIIVE